MLLENLSPTGQYGDGNQTFNGTIVLVWLNLDEY